MWNKLGCSTLQTRKHYNIFLSLRYEYMRKNAATPPTIIPAVVIQNANCIKRKLQVSSTKAVDIRNKYESSTIPFKKLGKSC